MSDKIKRGGGKAGRPMGTWSIGQLEDHVSENRSDSDELRLVMAELGHRRSQRSMELKSLVKRLDQHSAVGDRRQATDQAEAIVANLNRRSLASGLQHMLAQTFGRAGIAYAYGDRSEQGYDLDLIELGAKVRVMHSHGPIREPQDLTAGNVILVQGEDSANALSILMARQPSTDEGSRK